MVDEVDEAVENARRIVSDKRILTYSDKSVNSTFLSKEVKAVASILDSYDSCGKLSAGELHYLKTAYEKYDKVRKINDGFNQTFRDSLVSLLEEVLAVSGTIT